MSSKIADDFQNTIKKLFDLLELDFEPDNYESSFDLLCELPVYLRLLELCGYEIDYDKFSHLDDDLAEDHDVMISNFQQLLKLCQDFGLKSVLSDINFERIISQDWTEMKRLLLPLMSHAERSLISSSVAKLKDTFSNTKDKELISTISSIDLDGFLRGNPHVIDEVVSAVSALVGNMQTAMKALRTEKELLAFEKKKIEEKSSFGAPLSDHSRFEETLNQYQKLIQRLKMDKQRLEAQIANNSRRHRTQQRSFEERERLLRSQLKQQIEKNNSLEKKIYLLEKTPHESDYSSRTAVSSSVPSGQGLTSTSGAVQRSGVFGTPRTPLPRSHLIETSGSVHVSDDHSPLNQSSSMSSAERTGEMGSPIMPSQQDHSTKASPSGQKHHLAHTSYNDEGNELEEESYSMTHSSMSKESNDGIRSSFVSDTIRRQLDDQCEQIEALKRTIVDRNDEIDDLTLQVAVLRKEHSTVSDQLRAQKDKTVKEEAHCSRLEEELTSLRTVRKEDSVRLKDLSVKVETLTADLSKERSALQLKEAHLSQMKSDCSRLKSRVSELQANVESSSVSIKKLESSLREMKSSSEHARSLHESELSSSQKECSSLRSKVASLESNLSSLNDRLKSNSSELSNALSTIESLRTDLKHQAESWQSRHDAQSVDLKEAERQRDNYELELSKMTRSMEDIQKNFKESSEITKTQHSEIKKLEDLLSLERSAHSSTKAHVVELETSVRDLTDSLEESKNSFEKERIQLTSSLSSVRSELSSLRAEHDSFSARISSTNSTLEATVKDVSLERDKLQTRVKHLEDDLKKKNELNSQTQSSLEEQRSRLSTLKAELDASKEYLSETSLKLQESQEECKSHSAKVSDLIGEISNIKEKCTILSSSLDKSLGENTELLSKIEYLQGNLKQKDGIIESNQLNLESLLKEKSKLIQDSDSLRDTLEDEREIIRQTKSQLSSMTTEYSHLSANYTLLQTTHKDLETRFISEQDNYKIEKEAIIQHNSEQIEKIGTLHEKKKKEFEAQLKDMSKQLSRSDQILKERDVRIQELQDELKSIKSSLEETHAAGEMKDTIHQQHITEIKKLEDLLSLERSAHSSTKAHVVELETSVRDLTDSLEESKNSFEKERIQLTSSLSSVRSELSSLRAEHDSFS
ncbi:hypothetical protein ADUPG1_011222, partial [Aduncisulcus paluster]